MTAARLASFIEMVMSEGFAGGELSGAACGASQISAKSVSATPKMRPTTIQSRRRSQTDSTSHGKCL
jgi:hypothetical protein